MDFVELGAHCSLSFCRQQDFLPFTCEGCQQIFCSEHRSFGEHSCKNVPSGLQVFKCPLCAKGIDMPQGENPEIILEQHTKSGECLKGKELVCPGYNCKKKLSPINTVECRRCRSKVCPKHRYEDQHRCQFPQTRGQRRRGCEECGRQFLGEEELSRHLRFEHEQVQQSNLVYLVFGFVIVLAILRQIYKD